MRVNTHIQKLNYPEYTDVSSKLKKIICDLSKHAGREEDYSYVFSQDKELIKRIAELENLKEENILITAGADAALHHIAETFLEKGKIAIIPVPSFGRFEFHTKVVGAEEIFVKHIKFPYSFDLEKVTRRAEEKNADVIFLANPNNPTGELIGKKHLKQFIKENANRVVVIDEVLIEDIKDSIGESVNEYKNLIVVKSFSKLFGLPGLRVGYILANPYILKIVGKAVSPYEISSLSLYALKKILLNKKYLIRAKTGSKKARTLLKKELPFIVSNTEASIGIIDGGNRSSLFDFLLKHGILTVDGKNFRGLEKTNTVRVIITNQKDVQELINIIKKYQSL